MEQSGFPVNYDTVHGLFNEVPFYRGRPIVVSSGLADAVTANTSPIFAMDLTQVFFFATTGTPASLCIEEVPMPLQDTGSIGLMQYIHGALISLSRRAIVATDVDNSLSA